MAGCLAVDTIEVLNFCRIFSDIDQACCRNTVGSIRYSYPSCMIRLHRVGSDEQAVTDEDSPILEPCIS